MNVRRGFVNQKTGELQQQYSNCIWCAERIIRVNHLQQNNNKSINMFNITPMYVAQYIGL